MQYMSPRWDISKKNSLGNSFPNQSWKEVLKIKSQLKHQRKRGKRSRVVLTKNREGRDVSFHTKVNQNRH